MNPLANAVINITANTLGLNVGLATALRVTLHAFGQMSMSAMSSSNVMVQALGLVGAALTLTTTAVFAMVAAIGALSKAGGELSAGLHNVDQVFGSWGARVKQAADESALAFGTSKSEFMDYATTVGRQLEVLGIKQEVAAGQAIELVKAAQQLAQSRRISFGEAFQVVQRKGELFTEDEVRAMAVQMHLIHDRNSILDQGTEALVRNRLAMLEVQQTTDASIQSGDNWNSQISALLGNLQNLAEMIGRDLEPVMVSFLKMVNELLQDMIAAWQAAESAIAAVKQALGFQEAAPELSRDEQIALDARNEARIKEQRDRRMLGKEMAGPGRGGFQGGLAEFSKRVQQASFDQRSRVLAERQLTAAEKTAKDLDMILDVMRAGGAGRPPFMPSPLPF